jgi:5-formyltetrahydrofolate cyclo-ligase
VTGLAALKSEARRAAARRRQAAHEAADGPARAAAARAHLAAALAPLGPVPLGGYLPIRSELDPVPVMAAHPGPVGVPMVEAAARPLRFLRWHPGVALVAGAFGVMRPAGTEPLVPRALIVPLLAWDRRGHRLGYGGGFYDRTLAALRAAGPVLAVGLAYSAQEMAEVPVEPTDARLDALACEDGLIRF